MSTEQDRLSAIAEMIAVELGAPPAEVACWKELVRRVDVERFEETGEIVVRDEPEEAPTVPEEGLEVHYDVGEVRGALKRMKLRRSVASGSSRSSRRRERIKTLRDVPEPDYHSESTDLWLFGPLS